jgi:hypothetical protein
MALKTTNTNFTQKNEIYITSTEINENNKNNLPQILTDYKESKNLTQNNFQFTERKFKKNIKKLSKIPSNNDIDFSNINPCFPKENFYDYRESCNKFYPKMDHILKDNLSPRNIILKTRKFDKYEQQIISELKKDEIIQRSLGQGIFMRLQQYKTLTKNTPFKSILSNLKLEKTNLEIDENKKSISLTPSFKRKNGIRPKIHHLYDEKNKNNEFNKKDKNHKKFHHRRSSILNAPMNDLLRNDQPPSLVFREVDSTSNILKLNKMKNKIRDNIILQALEKCGELDARHLIGI